MSVTATPPVAEPDQPDQAAAGGDEPSGSPEPRPGAHPAAWRWAALFVLPYLLIGLAWVFSNPPGAAPDEPDHLVKAIGMGQLDIGDEAPDPRPSDPPLEARNESISRIVDIPARLAPDGYTCFAFNADATAACLPTETPSSSRSVERVTPIGAYPPYMYIPMGLAARAMTTPYHAFLAARLVALLSAAAALFAGAWILVRELGRAALLGAFVAITPMAVYAASSVTTSGLEIASGFAVGAIVVVCLRKPEALLAPRTHLLLAGVGSVLVLSRQMGVVTLAVLLAVLAAVAWRQVWQLIREHRLSFLASVGMLAVSGLAVAWWERRYDHPVNTGSPVSPHALDSFWALARGVVDSAIGVFGWLDTPLPEWALWAWLGTAALVVGMGLLLGARRERWALAAVLLATVAVTYGSYAAIFYPVGASSQGRHVLPLLAFCPVLAGVVIVERLREVNLGDALRRLFLAVAVVAGALQLLSLYYNARRYAVGLSGPMVFLGEAEWSPRLGWLPWLVVGAAGAVLLAVVAYASHPEPDPELTPGDP